MSDDPTTRPCICLIAGVPDRECPACHGTGRLPLTTDELLESLFYRFPHASLYFTGIEFAISGTGIYRTDTTMYPTPADALRAALREVSGG